MGNGDIFLQTVETDEFKKIISSMLVYDPIKRSSAEEICLFGPIFSMIKQLNLPGPKVMQMVIMRTVRINTELNQLSHVIDQCR